MSRCRLRKSQLTLVCALALWAFSANFAAAAPSVSTAPRPEKVTTVGSLRVERYGAGSPAMIFVPGLSCGAWVWADAVKQYAGTHTVYLVTLAGFDGLPAPVGNALDAADESLGQLITTEKLDRPIVVGHSLGGFLALRFGTEHAALVRGIVAVDGLPVYAPLIQMSAEQRTTTATTIAAQMRAAPPDQFAAQQKATLATMISAPADVDRVAVLAAKSDQRATADYFGDLLAADLRPQLTKLTVPTLEIAPVPTTPQAYEGPQAATSSMAERQAGYEAYYTSLFPGVLNLRVKAIPNSKHFVMIDQPKELFDAITSFVQALPR